MNLTPLVSVIVPIYNSGRFLHETIESVLAQTYSNWELFLVDDGSNDNSPEIAQIYANKYPGKIFYREHPNHQNFGVCTTRNLGISYAKGFYVAFLDADDVWLPHKLEHQVGIMQSQTDVGMVFSMSCYWSSWDPDTSNFNKDYIPNPNLKTDKLYAPGELTIICYPLGKAQAPCPSNILVRKDLLVFIGGFEETFQKSYQLYEDQAFLSKVYLSTSVYVSSECLDYYRLHKNSCMATTDNYLESRLFFLQWFEAYLELKKIDNQQLIKALKKAKWLYQHPNLYRSLRRITQTYFQAKNFIKYVIYKLFDSFKPITSN